MKGVCFTSDGQSVPFTDTVHEFRKHPVAYQHGCSVYFAGPATKPFPSHVLPQALSSFVGYGDRVVVVGDLDLTADAGPDDNQGVTDYRKHEQTMDPDDSEGSGSDRIEDDEDDDDDESFFSTAEEEECDDEWE